MLVVAAFLAWCLLISLTCMIMAGGDSWFEPTLDPLPARAQLVRWPPPALLGLKGTVSQVLLS